MPARVLRHDGTRQHLRLPPRAESWASNQRPWYSVCTFPGQNTKISNKQQFAKAECLPWLSRCKCWGSVNGRLRQNNYRTRTEGYLHNLYSKTGSYIVTLIVSNCFLQNISFCWTNFFCRGTSNTEALLRPSNVNTKRHYDRKWIKKSINEASGQYR